MIALTQPLSRSYAVIACTVLLCCLSGCSVDSSPETFPVRGMVRLADGTLLRGGVVEFEVMSLTKLVTARGKIGADGMFQLGTFKDGDGALPGKHRVVVITHYQIGSGAERPGEIPERKLDSKYNDFATSSLVIEVKREENEVVIQLK